MAKDNMGTDLGSPETYKGPRCTCPTFEDDDGTPIYAVLLTCAVHGKATEKQFRNQDASGD